MDLALNNLQRLICYITQINNQPKEAKLLNVYAIVLRLQKVHG